MKARLTEFWQFYKETWRDDPVFTGFTHTLSFVYTVLFLCYLISGDSIVFVICAVFALFTLLLASLVASLIERKEQ